MREYPDADRHKQRILQGFLGETGISVNSQCLHMIFITITMLKLVVDDVRELTALVFTVHNPNPLSALSRTH